ncbi:MAG TPA: GNVR domain-containing protein [Gemmatimonadaceae bacterium]|nr:GNVR domain-containing protein [Gemmatimonadaceae bacterium]
MNGELSAGGEYLTFSRWLAGVVSRWRVVGMTAALITAIALLATLVVPPVYRSNASFVANSSSQAKMPSGGSGSPISGLISQFGGSLGGDPSESPNFYLQLLVSRELLTRLLISKFPDPRTDTPTDSARLIDIVKLRSKEPARRMELAVKKLKTSINGGLDPKTNLVWFSTDAQYPELSSQISNRLIALVSAFNRETRVSRARSKREFLERRLDSAKSELQLAEGRLRFFYEQNRGMLIAPSLKFEEQRLKRDVDVDSDLYLNLQSQLEVARIDEINDAALITVIDTAVVPRKAQWPRYGAVTFTGIGLGLLAGFLIAGSLAVMEFWRDRNPDEWKSLNDSLSRELGRFRSRKSANAPPEPRAGRAAAAPADGVV